MRGPFTKEQLDLLYGTSDTLVFFMRKSGDTFVYEYVNPLCFSNFQTDLTGKTMDESMPPELAAVIKEHYDAAITSETAFTYRDYNLFSEKKTAYETEVVPMIHGTDIFVLAQSKDVSSNKKVEEDYLFYQSLIENSVDPMLMITADYTIFDMNPAYENTFGIKKTEWQGQPYKKLADVNSFNFAEVSAEFERSKAGKPSSSVILKRQKADGNMANFSVRYSPIKENGEVRAFHIVLRELDNEAQLKEELKQTENILESYKEALNYAALVGIWNNEGIIQFVNDNFKGTTGYEREELIGTTISEIGRAVISDAEYDEISRIVLSGRIWRGELKSLKKNGGFFWTDTTIIPLPKNAGQDDQLLSIMFDITDRKKLEEKLEFMAYHDSLTKLPNRLSIFHKFPGLTKQAEQHQQHIAVIFADGDNFKGVNDLYGHDVGDEFIYQFGQAIQRGIRQHDFVARVGGDEFLIVLTQLDSENIKDQVTLIIDRIKQQLANGWEIGEAQFSPTSSMGVAFYPQDGADMDEIVNKADQAQYRAKRSGKNRVLFFQDSAGKSH